MAEFWLNSGFALLKRDEAGHLRITDDFLRAYFMRPEIAPIEESCETERAFHERLMADPRAQATDDELSAFGDTDTADNYRLVLTFRDLLIERKTVEAAYLALIKSGDMALPPVFLDQLVHAILRNVLDKVRDPVRLRAAEVFFRD